MLTWVAEHWSEIATVAAAIVAILKWLGKREYATIIEGIVRAVEDQDSAILKHRIKRETKASPALDKIVQRVTEEVKT